MRTLLAYDFEMHDEPPTRSAQAVERLARMRGNIAGFSAVEAFVTLRRREPVGLHRSIRPKLTARGVAHPHRR